MFNVGGGEILVIALIALIVLGPQRLPDAARQAGKVMGDLRKLSSGFQSEMKTAFQDADNPQRVSARRNVLVADAAAEPVEPAPIAAAVASVSERPPAPAKKPSKAAAKKATKTTKKAAAKKVSKATKKATPAKKAVSKSARPRTSS